MLSVIIPLYNKESIIERTLRSVLSQDFDDYEVIIVNDGSTDNSVEIVRTIKDSRIRLIDQENGGPSKARNTGIKNAKGEWVYFLDADDEIPHGLFKLFSFLISQHKDADVIMGGIDQYDGQIKSSVYRYEDGLCKNVFKRIACGTVKPCTGSVLYKGNLCRKYLFNENIRRYEDFECFFRKLRESIVYLSSYSFVCINVEYAEASHGRKNINEDFVGHLDFKGKSFWEKMCLYQLYLGERTLYPVQIDKLYPTLKYRYDLLLLYKILQYFHAHS